MISSVPSTLKAFYRPLIERLSEAGFAVTLIASAGVEFDEFEKSGRVTVHRVPITRRISLLLDLSAIVKLIRLFKSNRYDLIHTHTPKAGLVGMIAGWAAGVRARVHTLHGLPLETARGVTRRFLAAADRLTCRLAHTVCVVSKSLSDRAVELRLCRPDKLIILGEGTACGVDLSRFERTEAVVEQARLVRRDHGIPERALVLGFVGWLVADKGVRELVEAFTELARDRDDLYLLMIGADGSDRDPLPRRTLTTIKDHPHICHAGLVPDSVPYYAAMDLCVLPTRREGFPYAVIEAAALGVATVATRVTGCIDAVVDGQTGVLIEANNVPALTSAIERLVSDASLRREMGEAAMRRVRASFGSDRLVKEHLRLYAATAPWQDKGESRRIAQ